MKHSLAILAIVKNCEKTLYKNVKKISKLCSEFSSVKMFVFENNSTDNTKEILKKCKEDFDFFNFWAFDYSEEELHQIAPTLHVKGKLCRIELITHARNFLLDRLKEESNNFDYTLVIDIDAFYFNVKKLPKIIKKYSDFDCISVNGLTKRLRYRDAFAFRSKDFPFGPEFFNDYWWSTLVFKMQRRYFGNNLIPVFSAFGGMAIYKTQSYISSSYACHPTKEYLAIQKQIYESVNIQDKEKITDISKPLPNTNFNSDIICEHVPLHYKMIFNGFDKIYMLPSWIMFFID